jgi:hypothetical protein
VFPAPVAVSVTVPHAVVLAVSTADTLPEAFVVALAGLTVPGPVTLNATETPVSGLPLAFWK